jgi:hypothetical protein
MTEYVRATIVNEDGQHRLVTTPISMTETLTLRDQFAMAALMGLLAAQNGSRYSVEDAYRIADDMLEARKEKK